MAANYTAIQTAFLDGLNEIYSTMFTDQIGLMLLDETATQVNIYNESPQKKYKPTVLLCGNVRTTFEQGEEPIEGVQVDAVIDIPTKQLITSKIPHLSEAEQETLKKAKFTYRGIEYLVDKVKPKTLVADMWQVYSFNCHIDKKTSLKGV